MGLFYCINRNVPAHNNHSRAKVFSTCSGHKKQTSIHRRRQPLLSAAANTIDSRLIADQPGCLQIGTSTDQVAHQRVGFQAIPLLVGSAIAQRLQGVGNSRYGVRHRATNSNWVNSRTATRPLAHLFRLLLDSHGETFPGERPHLLRGWRQQRRLSPPQ